MAKRKDGEQVETAPEAVENADVLPMGATEASPEAVEPAEPKQRWKLQSKPGLGGVEMVVEADTVEDAIRLYNGQSTAFSRKQLVIEAI